MELYKNIRKEKLCDRIFVLTVTIWTFDFFSLLIKMTNFHENEPVQGPCPVVPLSLRVRPESDSAVDLYTDIDAEGKIKYCEVPGPAEQLHEAEHPIALERWDR